ncbi:nitric oxide-associated protein 1-like [Anneissia japonica]|uniref:nitric oxide-associated protein 1-like n=1 Tax=Anneissia japonica TaxID=1529436 RepID=UPI001425A2C1|nr:nitric oxide-associated protein 1-like [Anneissia japonica]XP_033099323.1 nitric oxide-associated protein 1-like [Anneissia japonica]XP_033099324.1 nitric oxide-associated protein 1-like [Anneissia japonica]XP_033099325.1 nitric oxide-associated protein 1-like [Anneissia japonica]
MISSKVINNFYHILKNAKIPYRQFMESKQCLSSNASRDSDAALGLEKKPKLMCSNEVGAIGTRSELGFDELEHCSDESNSCTSSGHNIDSQYFGGILNDAELEGSNQPHRPIQSTQAHEYERNSPCDPKDLSKIHRQYFSSTTKVNNSQVQKEYFGNTNWIYDSIEEIESDAELSKIKQNSIKHKMIKIDKREDYLPKQFEPHEFPSPLHESREHSAKAMTDSLVNLRSKFEHVHNINKMINKRDIIRGRKAETLPKLHNLPANVQLEELEPIIAETVKLITKPKKKINKKKLNYLKLYGTSDPEAPLTTIPCCGCGALLHCQDPTVGGYLASEKFMKLTEAELVKTPCQRCTLIINYNHAINVSVTEEDFQKMFRKIQEKYALILVMVDLLDFPISLIPNMKSMIGRNKKVVIIGNKVDLLPADSHDCHKRVIKQLKSTCISNMVCEPDQILDVLLLSSKLGYGVEDLITKVQSMWATRGDVYLIGTANSGKSTLFNRLLNSDFCKTKAKWLYKKATVSKWPGTTLNLLKFPILKPNIERISKREARLQEERESNEWGSSIKRDKQFNALGYFQGHVGRSFEWELYDDHRQAFNLVSGNKRRLPIMPFKFDPHEFSEGKWLFDTPGIIRQEQVLSKLTSEELKLTVPSQALRPKTLVIRPGQTVFLGGLGRLDYLDGIQTIFCTMFAAHMLPIRVVNTENADEFYLKNVGYPHLKVPAGGAERLKTLALLTACDDITVEGIDQKESAADILFASAGWSAITPNKGLKAVLRPHTIGGVGCVVRTPAMLPYIVNLRGSRLGRNQPFYRVNVEKLVQYQ